ncbi:MAG: hypothetical protein GDYSWBUE_001515 [Candidatus Fervidibacterota bacterium]
MQPFIGMPCAILPTEIDFALHTHHVREEVQIVALSRGRC